MCYIILLLIILSLSFFCKIRKIDIKNNKNYLIIITTILILFLGLRSQNVGLDMENYKIFFNDVQKYSLNDFFINNGFEIGFKIYTRIITIFSSNFSLYIFITSILSMVGVYFFIKDNSKNYFASLYIFITFNYYIYLFCTLRQSIAISIVLFSIKYIKQNKFFPFLLLIIVASLFHKTAVFFLAIYFLKDIEYRRKYIKYFLGLSLPLYIFRGSIVHFFTDTFYSQYISYRNMSGSGYFMLIVLVGIIIGICYLFKKFDLSVKNNRIMLYMLLLTIPFQILATMQGLIARVTLYFSISLIIIVPNAIESIENKKARLVYYVLFVALLMTFYCIEIVRNSMYMPYEFLDFIN